MLSQATLLKFTYLLLCWLGSLLLPPGIPGILLAIFLLISSECAEALFLRWRRAGAAIVPASR